MATPFKMKGMSFGKGTDSDTDLTKKTGLGPRATVKPRQFDEKEDATLERMENSTKFDGKSEMEINKARKKSEKKHNIAANITEGTVESQKLRRKENAKKYTSDDEEQAYENAQNDFDTDNPTKAQLAKALKEIKAEKK